jgi:hypothetical protein
LRRWWRGNSIELLRGIEVVKGGGQFDRAREAVLEVEGGGEMALEVERGREDRVKGLG